MNGGAHSIAYAYRICVAQLLGTGEFGNNLPGVSYIVD